LHTAAARLSTGKNIGLPPGADVPHGQPGTPRSAPIADGKLPMIL
jgi:hypothetical protein